MRNFDLSLSPFERNLWMVSVAVVGGSSLLGGVSWMSLFASLIGVTALIYVAKGHVLGQILTMVFGIVYGVISFHFSYYGEVITYVGMTVPMAALATISWLRHPFAPGKQEVAVAHLTPKDWRRLALLTLGVTAVFYVLLALVHTENLPLSTLSIATSFAAAYLTYRRSPYYALAYACNDVVLIGLWLWASMEEPSYLTMVACFVMFLANDLYGYVNWKRMHKQQLSSSPHRVG